jgi:8-hydroxy-5-deazaflavin:NADPH oxidoreductase
MDGVRIGILGSGTVGTTLGTALAAAGHDVRIGSRAAGTDTTRTWAEGVGDRASTGTFADAAAFAELLINATAGQHSLAVVGSAPPADLEGKVLLDVSNPLDHSAGFPPSLMVPSTDSVAEQLQRAHPGLRVVKCLNTVTAAVMVAPATIAGDHQLPIAGDDASAKEAVRGLLRELGWRDVQLLDFGGLAGARAMEAYVLFWVALMIATGTPLFNIEILRA